MDSHVSFASLITFVVYLLVMLIIGFVAYRRTHALADYLLGGRKLGAWTTALSAGASDMSGWLLMGLPGYALLAGLESVWLVIGLLVGTYLNWRFVAYRLRKFSVLANDALTMPEYFAQRFDDHHKLLRMVCAFFILLFFLFYTSAGLVAGGKLFETVFGLSYTWAVTAGAAVILLYTLFGGFLAVAWTDVVQGLMMIAALIIVPIFAFTSGSSAASIDTGWWERNSMLFNPLTDAQGVSLSVVAVISLLGWGLGYFGQPHILARFKAIRSLQEVARARRIAVTWTGVALLCATLVGLSAIGLVDAGLQVDDAEKIFLILVDSLFHPVVAGVLLAAILAAIMSTADSQLLVSGSVLAEDFYKTLVRPNAQARELLYVARVAVLGVCLVAYYLALHPGNKVLDLVGYAWAGFGAAFGPALLLSLYWRRMNRYGALAGIVVGGLSVVIWKQLVGGWFDLYELVPGFIFASIAVWGVSLLTPRPDERLLSRFEDLRA